MVLSNVVGVTNLIRVSLELKSDHPSRIVVNWEETDRYVGSQKYFTIADYVTDGIDILIRRTVEEIPGLPIFTNINLLFTPKPYSRIKLVQCLFAKLFNR